MSDKSRLLRTPTEMCSCAFNVTREEADTLDLHKLSGSRSSGLRDCIEDWKNHFSPQGDYPPTHRMKKECNWWDLPVGTLLYIRKRRWSPAHWQWADSREIDGGVRFYKTRGKWKYPRMVRVDELGRIAGPIGQAIFEHPGREWIREYCEPVKTV